MNDTYAGIGAPETLPIDKLNLYHKNPRKGDVEAIKGSLVANGQFRPIVVNKGSHTGRPFEVVAGNHTLKAFRELAEENPKEKRWHQIDCWVVDVDEERATKIVLADNRTADLGSYDDTTLLDLLDSVDHDLEGTGYIDDDLDMLRDMADGAPSLDDLEDEYGEPEDDDFWVTLRFKVPPVLADQWSDWARAFDTPEEAFEGLMDKAGNYGAGA